MSERERRLAAIMFTDIVGYTSFSQKDEVQAIQLLDEHRSRVRPFFLMHGGREIKSLGDGFLVVFPSALEAVRCAVEIQQSLHELDQSRPPERRLLLRIGVHLGDVVYGGEDVYGDAVNIASRIEPLAKPGGICVTEQVQQQIRNRFSSPVRSLGKKTLKNVDEPVNVYELILPWETSEAESELSARPQVAVLPFTNMSPDQRDEFFADGLTEEMITELSGISGIGVIARTSIMHFKNTQKSVKEICRDLGVGYALEGSVRKSGNMIRVTAQLIDTNERHVWAERYDRELNDIFHVQSEIAEKVAGTLELKLMHKDSSEKQTGLNLESYTLCMRARSLNDRRNREANQQAIALFNEALRHDPDYARAVAGLADCYRAAWNWRFIGEEGKLKARELALRAIELDDTLSEPHATLGFILDWDCQWDEAEAEFVKAVSLNPSYVWAHQWYATHLLKVGRPEDGLREALKARELDPLSPAVMWNMARDYWFAGKDDDAISEYTKLINLEPGMGVCYYTRGWVFSHKGLQEEALADWETYHELTKDEYGYTLLKAASEALWGSRDKALQLAEHALSILDRTPKQFAESPFWFYALLGDHDSFYKWLDWAINRSEVSPLVLLYEPSFQKMREDPRYIQVLKRMNLPEFSAVAIVNSPT